VVALNKRVKVDEIKDEFLRSGWSQDTIDAVKGIVSTTASSKTETTGKTWTAEQVRLVRLPISHSEPIQVFDIFSRYGAFKQRTMV
jgi:hypothetical protein